MAIRSSIDIEEGVHLTFALVLIVMHLRTHVRLLEFASEAVEVSCGSVVSAIGIWDTSRSRSRLLCLLFLFCRLLRVVCIWVVATMNGWIVASPLAPGGRAGAGRARARCESSSATREIPVEMTY